MNNYITGDAIKKLREKRNLTQLELAQRLCVSDKAVSKWETGRGLPDISLLAPLSDALNVSVSELLSGKLVQNNNPSANMLKTKLYVCPICGNIIHSCGSAVINCCGVTLPELETECDAENLLSIEKVEDEYYACVNHPMEKEHYISFLMYTAYNKTELIKLYPEGSAEGRFKIRGKGYILYYCNRHGLHGKPVGKAL